MNIFMSSWSLLEQSIQTICSYVTCGHEDCCVIEILLWSKESTLLAEHRVGGPFRWFWQSSVPRQQGPADKQIWFVQSSVQRSIRRLGDGYHWSRVSIFKTRLGMSKLLLK